MFDMSFATDTQRPAQNPFSSGAPDPKIDLLIDYYYGELNSQWMEQVRVALRSSRDLKTLYDGVRIFSKRFDLHNATEHKFRFQEYVKEKKAVTWKAARRRLREK